MHTRQQILCIHGGNTFSSHESYLADLRTKDLSLDRMRSVRDWKANLQDTLGQNYDILTPRMPNGGDAQYAEWSLWFSRILTLVSSPIILIGHSLGGAFLVRYLSENRLPVTIRATLLVAAPFQAEDGESLNDFAPPPSLALLENQGGDLFLYHSTDDPVVPYSHAEAYARILPHATFRTCEGRGHFNTESFQTLENDIRNITGGHQGMRP